MTVRNRLAITKKAIKAIHKHTVMPYQLYVYNNQTNYKIDEHFEYFSTLYKLGRVTQVTFNTDASTFNAFSKATACNMFGKQHQQDPDRNKYLFLLIMDNDIILMPGWDKHLKNAWKHLIQKKLTDRIKVIGQTPGGIKGKKEKIMQGDKLLGRVGTLGGSGLWSVRPNFFEDVGFLDLKLLVGQNKRHDQLYWRMLSKASGNRPYILALHEKLGIHCGKMCGSICNRLTRNRSKSEAEKLELIKFEKAEERIEALSFDEFKKLIYNDNALKSDW
jgi:hypothetical protein